MNLYTTNISVCFKRRESFGKVGVPIPPIENIQSFFSYLMRDFRDGRLQDLFRHVGDVDPGEFAGVYVNFISEFTRYVEKVEWADSGLRHFCCSLEFLILLREGFGG